ncbi:lactonase family protein [Algoriphagus sp. CAU 1675]|uniref:lactonase family protein n=1 Tax=Algoriphagus sp. CAU 1675 TaxID=3032597 RepID=UPI0023DA9B5C|nr:lactonase family protein [Algoriphagus sp. CAU 1675]MDF2157030.1 lactonase family protein [Algoriphagus sp. CAU 1675]
MRKIFQIIFIAFLAACSAPEQHTSSTNSSMEYKFLVGTYTDSPIDGINMITFSPDSNLLVVETIAAGIANPSFVLASADGKRVFSLEEEAGEKGGRVLSFERSEDNALTLIDQKESMGDHPCHIALSPEEDFLVVSNYTGGSLSAFRISADGNLEFLQKIQHEGKSINAERQEAPHVHSANFSPDGKKVLVADLGTDKVYVYNFDKGQAEPLSLFAEIPVNPGDGPRHLAFSKDGSEVFVVEELTASLDIFSYEGGKMQAKQRLSLLSEGFTGAVGAAEVRVSPDGQNVYVSNRGDANTISVFGKNADGAYERIQNISSGGIMPRNFNLTSDGKYLFAAHQASNDIILFERDPETGILSQTLWKAEVHKPVYLFPLKN